MTLTSRSLMWVVIVQHKPSDQYLTSGKVSTRSIHGFKGYRLLKTLTKNVNILSNADTDADADTDAVVAVIALPVLSYRRANNLTSDISILLLMLKDQWHFTIIFSEEVTLSLFYL